MSDLERQQSICELLSSQTFVSVRELQQSLGVSAATVRRDIDKLNEAGVARKVYGGVAALEDNLWRRPPSALPFVENRDLAVEQKRAIAAAAEGLVRDGSSVIVHAGSTCFTFGCRHGAAQCARCSPTRCRSRPTSPSTGTCHLTVGGGDIHREPGILLRSRPRADALCGAVLRRRAGRLGRGDPGAAPASGALRERDERAGERDHRARRQLEVRAAPAHRGAPHGAHHHPRDGRRHHRCSTSGWCARRAST